jgi:hypothetical protein
MPYSIQLEIVDTNPNVNIDPIQIEQLLNNSVIVYPNNELHDNYTKFLSWLSINQPQLNALLDQ